MFPFLLIPLFPSIQPHFPTNTLIPKYLFCLSKFIAFLNLALTQYLKSIFKISKHAPKLSPPPSPPCPFNPGLTHHQNRRLLRHSLAGKRPFDEKDHKRGRCHIHLLLPKHQHLASIQRHEPLIPPKIRSIR